MKNYGYKPPIVEEKNYVLGGVFSAPFEILQESGSWIDYIPIHEEQRQEGFDTNGCTQFATLNALEMLFKRKFGEIKNYSERFVGVMAENDLDGNDPHKTIEAIRHFGCIDDFNLPFSKNLLSFDEYYSPKPMSKYYLDLGKKFLNEYAINHEYVFSSFDSLKTKQEKLMKALKTSPVGVSVSAWQKNDKDLYFKFGQDNHWTVCIDFKEGEYWLIDDSYLNDGSQLKKLDWDFDFGFAKRYHIEKRPTQNEKKMYSSLLDLMKQLLMIMSEQIKLFGKLFK